MSEWPADWAAVRLADCGTWLSGGTPATGRADFWHGEIPWVSSGSLTQFRISSADRFVTELGAQNGTRLVGPGTILMVVRGMSLKTEFRLGVTTRTVAFGQDCKALVPRDGIDPEFLGYAIAAIAPDILALVDEAGHGTGRLNSDQLYAQQVGVPGIREQAAITEVLAALDDKIAANLVVEQASEAVIAALFRQAVSMEGSRTRPLFEVFQFDFGEPFKGEYFNASTTGRPLIRIRDIQSAAPQVWTTEVRASETVVGAGEVLVGMDAEFRPYWWLGEPGLLNQRVCRVRSRDFGRAFVREALLEPMSQIESYKSGTTVIHLNKRDLAVSEALVPEPERVADASAQADALLDRRVAAAVERRTLAEMRDTLLPQLMSGKIRVKDAENVVSEAV